MSDISILFFSESDKNAFVMPARQGSYNSRHQFERPVFNLRVQPVLLTSKSTFYQQSRDILCKQIRGEGPVQAHHDVAELHERISCAMPLY
jgi:hypothetical protein